MVSAKSDTSECDHVIDEFVSTFFEPYTQRSYLAKCSDEQHGVSKVKLMGECVRSGMHRFWFPAFSNHIMGSTFDGLHTIPSGKSWTDERRKEITRLHKCP